MPRHHMMRLQHAVFPARPGVTPAVLVAASYTCRGFRTTGIGNLLYPDWVVDVPWQTGLRVRIGSASAPWRERPSGRLHIYAPQTPFWEDGQFLPEGTLSGIYLVVRDPAAGLAHLTGSGGFAAVDDPEGRLRRVLAAAFVEPGNPSFWRCQMAWAGLMEELASAVPVAGELYRVGGAPASEHLAGQVEALLRQHLDRPLALDGLARQVGISVSSLCHRFRAEAGETVMARWRRLRVERALALLPRGHRLDDIAELCGFSDRFHLSRTVRLVTGKPPAEWRRIGDGEKSPESRIPQPVPCTIRHQGASRSIPCRTPAAIQDP